jgi:hypothetical protein
MIVALLVAAAAAMPPIAPLTSDFDASSKGTVGFQFAFPLGGSTPVGTGSTIGATYFLDHDLAVRFDFGLDAVVSPGGTPAFFSLGLGLRSYQYRRGPVAVFLWPALIFGREANAGAPGPVIFASEYLTLAGGAGAEYFFADHFSVGGQLGVGLKFGNLGGPAASSVITTLTTATSGLFASVYF